MHKIQNIIGLNWLLKNLWNNKNAWSIELHITCYQIIVMVSLYYINLGFALLCTTSNHQLINWWKKKVDFVKIKFHLNENIEWHCMHLELNQNLLILNPIEFKYIDWHLN